jgi:transcriptional regulator with GAF, ATPase, and Fis domain
MRCLTLLAPNQSVNIRRVVLQEANWKIKGADGAAELMGVKPTTLLARMKKWGLKKPAA